MTGLVDRAERRELVRRTASPHDRRAVLVSLTPQGHELARQGAAPRLTGRSAPSPHISPMRNAPNSPGSQARSSPAT